MSFLDRYSSAVHSANLKSGEDSHHEDASANVSDTDMLGAAGFAAKAMRFDGRPGAPLAIALARLFAGDNRAVREIVEHMAQIVWSRAHSGKVKLRRIEAHDIACAVLAWHRDGVCKVCGGHGYQLVPGAPSLSESKCPACHGIGKRPFDDDFPTVTLALARWLLDQVEQEMGRAGQAAMAALAPRLDL